MNPHIHSLAGAVTIALYGQDRLLDYRLLALEHGALGARVCLIKAPSDVSGLGFQTITEPVFGPPADRDPDVYAEGVILTGRRTAAVLPTADCPVLVLYESTQKRLLMTHAGRPAMTPEPGEKIKNIVTIAYDKIVKNCIHPDVHAYITGAICGYCFIHNQLDAEELIKPFDKFGEIAFTDRSRGALDLVAVITYQLMQMGVPSENIQNDGLCTFESDWLISYRQDRGVKRNAVVAVLI